jgi:hypothetical protein
MSSGLAANSHWSKCRVFYGQEPRVVQRFVHADASATIKAHTSKLSDGVFVSDW